MKTRIVSLLVCSVLCIGLISGCGSSVEGRDSGENKEEEIVLTASEAETKGQGINQEFQTANTAYSEELDSIVNFGSDSTITYTVPEGTEGNYDVYIEYGKTMYPYGSTQAGLVVNGEDEYVLPADVEGCKEDFSDLYTKGKFLMAESLELTSGDTLTVQGKPGFEMEFNGTKFSTMTSVGNMYLYSAGTEVATGYGKETVENKEESDPKDPLSGLNIVWLGSSVTYGMQSGGYSMADAIEDGHQATECYKYAISGTTLVNEDPTSYVSRLQEISPQMEIDLFVVQLSTNDASMKKPLGTISDSKKIEDFDDTTITGAMEKIIAYIKQTWDCPIVFYTGTYYDDQEYSKMVDSLLQLQDKWDIGVVDLWDNEEMTALYGSDQYQEYMADDVHPTRKGYVEWWTPVFENYLSEYMSNQ